MKINIINKQKNLIKFEFNDEGMMGEIIINYLPVGYYDINGRYLTPKIISEALDIFIKENLNYIIEYED